VLWFTRLDDGVDWAGFDLDLSAMRLVQFGEDEPAEWMTERQKIIEKAKGRKFMDMWVVWLLCSFYVSAAEGWQLPDPSLSPASLSTETPSLGLMSLMGSSRNSHKYSMSFFSLTLLRPSDKSVQQLIPPLPHPPEFPSHPNSTHVDPIIKLLSTDGPKENLKKYVLSCLWLIAIKISSSS
jgi:hypothetical protein